MSIFLVFYQFYNSDHFLKTYQNNWLPLHIKYETYNNNCKHVKNFIFFYFPPIFSTTVSYFFIFPLKKWSRILWDISYKYTTAWLLALYFTTVSRHTSSPFLSVRVLDAIEVHASTALGWIWILDPLSSCCGSEFEFWASPDHAATRLLARILDPLSRHTHPTCPRPSPLFLFHSFFFSFFVFSLHWLSW